MRSLALITLGLSFMMMTVAGCGTDDTNTVTAVAPTQQQLQAPQPSYHEYRQVVKTFVDQFLPEGYTKIHDTLHYPVTVIVDPENTFGQRETLTLSGEKADPTPEPTQNRIIYQNQQSGLVLYLDFVYSEKLLPNNMLSWDNSPLPQLADYPQLRTSTENLLSFGHTLIKITITNVGGPQVLTEKLSGITKQVVQTLQTKKESP